MMLHSGIQSIKNMMSDYGLTYSELSIMTGLSESKIKKIFSNHQIPRIDDYDLILMAVIRHVNKKNKR